MFRKTVLESVGIDGHYTKPHHSLKAITATRLFEVGDDEQLIMQRKGHPSTAVRSCKRTGEKL